MKSRQSGCRFGVPFVSPVLRRSPVIAGQYGVLVETPEPRAWIGRRIAALIIDWLASLAVARLVFPQFGYGSDSAGFATLGVFAVEVTLLTWLTGASFGQRIIGLRVVPIDSGRLPLWRAALRTLLVCLVIPAVVYDNQGRGVHDRLAGTNLKRVR